MDGPSLLRTRNGDWVRESFGARLVDWSYYTDRHTICFGTEGGREFMTRKSLVTFVTLSIAASLLIASAPWALCADLVGKISNDSGQVASGVHISVLDSAGSTVAQTVTDTTGAYAIHNLRAGIYTISSNGSSVVSYVGDRGLSVSWGMSPGSPPVAVASPVGTSGNPLVTGGNSSIAPSDSPIYEAAEGLKRDDGPPSHRCRYYRKDDDKRYIYAWDDDRRCPSSSMY